MIGGDFPDFLQANAVFLRIAIGFEIVFRFDFLGQGPPGTFSKKDIFAEQFHAWLIVRLVAAILGNAHDAGDNAAHFAILAIHDFRRREAREDLDFQFFRPLAKPAADIGQRANIATMIVHEGGEGKSRHAERTVRAEQLILVRIHLGADRTIITGAPVRDQLIQRFRVEHQPRQDVCANLAALLQDHDFQLFPGLVGQLFRPDRRCQARWSAADDDQVKFHGLAFAHQFSPKSWQHDLRAN